jgi:mono/diheme cytochrome c family protein
MNPDGTRQMVYFGNMHAGGVFIDAKPIPGSEKIVASFERSGHGGVEHNGWVAVIDPRNGPDDRSMARVITQNRGFRDPWAFSENAFMAAFEDKIVLIDGSGEQQSLFTIPKDWQSTVSAGKVIRDKTEIRANLSALMIHEPRPLTPHPRERIVGETVNPSKETGKLTLVDVYHGRNMSGVKRGEIKKLLIIETLPMPIHYTGGMEPMTFGGSFTLERVVGTVPVDPDGSAHFELPATRAFFFVALDKDDLAVKRMQSFLSVMPGENTACIGCHEERTATPLRSSRYPTAAKRPPSPITPLADYKGVDYAGHKLNEPPNIPDVIDYPRDIQPIWDAHCVQCHSPEKRDGNVSLVGDRGPMYSISYFTITAKSLVADGRNRPLGNYPPRTLGSGASKLMKYCDGSHYDAKLTERERTLLRLWIDTGAAYLGTYAGLGSGMVGGYAINTLDRQDLQWTETQAMEKVLKENCVSCHTGKQLAPGVAGLLPLSASHEIAHTWWVADWNDGRNPNDVRRKYARHLLYDLTYPEKSTLLLAPLAKSAGGYESCGKAILTGRNDARYETILAGIQRAKQQLDTVKRFDMPGFQPRPEYLREMKRFGILPVDFDDKQPVDYYDLDQRYWQSLWYKPL